MSIHGTLDVLLHFHSFRNIDLFSRGSALSYILTETVSLLACAHRIYTVRASVMTGNSSGAAPAPAPAPSSGPPANGAPQVAIPYAFFSKPATMSTFVRDQEIPCLSPDLLAPAQIVNETSEFASRAFVIKCVESTHTIPHSSCTLSRCLRLAWFLLFRAGTETSASSSMRALSSNYCLRPQRRNVRARTRRRVRSSTAWYSTPAHRSR